MSEPKLSNEFVALLSVFAVAAGAAAKQAQAIIETVAPPRPDEDDDTPAGAAPKVTFG